MIMEHLGLVLKLQIILFFSVHLAFFPQLLFLRNAYCTYHLKQRIKL